jgi:hypothetical protein
MKKWLCSVFGHVYDPEKENIPAEIRGAAICRYVDTHDKPAAHAAARKYKLLTSNVFGYKNKGTPCGDEGGRVPGTAAWHC